MCHTENEISISKDLKIFLKVNSRYSIIKLCMKRGVEHQVSRTNLFAFLTNIFPFTLLHVHQEIIKTTKNKNQKEKKVACNNKLKIKCGGNSCKNKENVAARYINMDKKNSNSRSQSFPYKSIFIIHQKLIVSISQVSSSGFPKLALIN